MTKKNKPPSPLILLLSPLIFSLELVFLKWFFSSSGADPVTFTANRSLLALVPFGLLFGRELVSSLRKNLWKTLGWAAALGVVRFAADLIYFTAQPMTTPTTFILLSQLSSFTTAIMAYLLLKERLTGREILGGVIMVAGAAYVTLSGGNLSLTAAAAIVLVFVVVISISNILTKKGISAGNGRNSLLLGSVGLATAGYYLIEPLLFGKSPLAAFSMQFPYSAFAAGFFFLNLTALFYCFEKFGPSRTQIAGVANVLFSAVFSAIFLGLVPSAAQVAGGLAIVAGVAVFLRAKE